MLLKAGTLDEFEKALRKVYPSSGAMKGRTGAAAAVDLEDRITGEYLAIVRKIAGTLPDPEKTVLHALLMEYEIQNIKTILHGKSEGLSTEILRAALIPMGPSAVFPYEDLLAEEEMGEILRLLRAHPLGEEIGDIYREKFVKHHNMYLTDTAIDLAYLRWLYDTVGRLDSSEAGLLKKMIGQRIDAANVAWILRFKEHFQMTPEEIMVSLVPRGHYLDLRDLRALSFAEDSKIVLSRLRSYAWKSALPSDKLDLPAIEAGLDRFLKEEYYRVFRRESLHFAGIVAFVLLARAVAQDLIRVLEGVEYRLDKAEIQNDLFFANRAGDR